jgi:hypothetical protein
MRGQVCRSLALLDPEALKRRFLAWRQPLTRSSQGRLIVIEGKRWRRSFISSLPGPDAKGIAESVRAHGGVEKGPHGSLLHVAEWN